jgi:hypothetical protein
MLRELFGRCGAHRGRLVSGEVPVRYGLIRFSAALSAARRREFRNARSFVLGGCLVHPDNPKTQSVRYCPDCREAEAAWHAAHPRGE